MTKKTFELSVLVSLLNGETIVQATDAQVEGLVQHIVGEDAVKQGYGDACDTAIEYIEANHPKVVEAARCVGRSRPDPARYNKLIDLFRKNHEIGSLVQVKEKAPEEQEEQLHEPA